MVKESQQRVHKKVCVLRFSWDIYNLVACCKEVCEISKHSVNPNYLGGLVSVSPGSLLSCISALHQPRS